MRSISYSAPGKVILSGEHAVIYGKPAIVTAINRRLTFKIFEKNSPQKDKIILYISEIVKNYLKKENISFKNTNFDYKIISSIPIGRGLGSSAALSVAATAAFLEFYSKRKFSRVIINSLAYEVEKYFHKNSSGVDVAVSCFGGLIFYRKEFEFIKSISLINIKIKKNISENILLIDSGKPEETTAEMINNINNKYKNKSQSLDSILNKLEKVTKKLTFSLVEGDVDSFIKSLVNNEILLEMLEIVSKKTKKLLKNLTKFGVGKITGAGGFKTNSGYILFFSLKKDELTKFLLKNKINYFEFKQDSQGLL